MFLWSLNHRKVQKNEEAFNYLRAWEQFFLVMAKRRRNHGQTATKGCGELSLKPSNYWGKLSNAPLSNTTFRLRYVISCFNFSLNNVNFQTMIRCPDCRIIGQTHFFEPSKVLDGSESLKCKTSKKVFEIQDLGIGRNELLSNEFPMSFWRRVLSARLHTWKEIGGKE